MRRRLLLMGDEILPIFHAPLTEHANDIISGLQGNISGNVQITEGGAYFSSGPFIRYSFPALNFNESFTFEYEVRNLSNSTGLHQLIVEFGNHASGECLFTYSPSANSSRGMIAAWGSGLENYFYYPSGFNYSVFRTERIMFDATQQKFTMKMNGIDYEIQYYQSGLPAVPKLGFNIGGSNLRNDKLYGYVRNVKIWNKLI